MVRGQDPQTFNQIPSFRVEALGFRSGILKKCSGAAMDGALGSIDAPDAGGVMYEVLNIVLV